MKENLMMDFSVAKETHSITVTREFNARLPVVWDAYTRSELLDQWWAPKPWKAQTKHLDFRVGGYWLYAMLGPEGEEHWSRIDYKQIEPHQSFHALDGFADADGHFNPELPQSHWKISFEAKDQHTLVRNQIIFEDLMALEKILEMGFREGYTMAMENLDELLEKTT